MNAYIFILLNMTLNDVSIEYPQILYHIKILTKISFAAISWCREFTITDTHIVAVTPTGVNRAGAESKYEENGEGATSSVHSFLDPLVNCLKYKQFIVHINLKVYVMFGFWKVLSISLTFYGEGLWQGFKFSCETTDNWTCFVRILKIIGLITWWVFSYKDDLFTLKSLNTLRWLMNVYVEVRSVYLLNRPLMIKTY